MALPNTRNKTYASGDSPASADLNDLQDQIIALWGGLKAPLYYNIPVDRGARGEPTGATVVFDETEMELNIVTTGATSLIWGIPIIEGQRIITLDAYIRTKSSTGNVQLSLTKNDRSGLASTIATGSAITAAGLATCTPTAPGYPNVLTESYQMFLGLPASETITLAQLRVKMDTP